MMPLKLLMLSLSFLLITACGGSESENAPTQQVKGSPDPTITVEEREQIEAISEEVFWQLAEIQGISPDRGFKEAKYEFSSLLFSIWDENITAIEGHGVDPWVTIPYCRNAFIGVIHLPALNASDKFTDVVGHATMLVAMLSNMEDEVMLAAEGKGTAAAAECSELEKDIRKSIE